MKQVKISESLFNDLVLYHLCQFQELEEQIQKGLTEKMEAILRHDDYTQYKTATDEKEREDARRKYLDCAGILPDFRW